MKYIFFTFDGHGLAIAYHLQQEGCEVMVGQVQDKKEIISDIEQNVAEEDTDDRERRLQLYNGLLEKFPAEQMMDKIRNYPEKKEFFIFFDFNNMFRFSEEIQKLGFPGNYPTENDHLLEIDRNIAKDFVNRYYSYLKSPQKKYFSKISEAIAFLTKSNDIWVLKGNNEKARTVIPDVDDPDLARDQIVEALETYTENYEKVGFILESMVSPMIELTPEKLYYEGVPLATTLDIENKPLGSGNLSIQTGCAADLVFPTQMTDRINKIAFPPIVDEMAKKHRGLFIWDASILINKRTGTMYFGEFCANRPGYNSMFTELAQVPSVHDFFEDAIKQKNPFSEGTIASSVRIFNLPRDSHSHSRPDLHIDYKENYAKDVWLMDAKKKDGKVVTTGFDWNLAVLTGANKSIEEAVRKTYKLADDYFSFEAAYYRPKFDYLSLDYPTSILNRLNYGIERHLYEIPFIVKVGEIKRKL